MLINSDCRAGGTGSCRITVFFNFTAIKMTLSKLELLINGDCRVLVYLGRVSRSGPPLPLMLAGRDAKPSWDL